MSYRIVFHSLAEKDLADLYDYIADRSGATRAWNFIQPIRQYCEALVTFPERGTRRDDLRSGLRVVGYKRQVSIAFAVKADTIVIYGVFYRGRQITRKLLANRNPLLVE